MWVTGATPVGTAYCHTSWEDLPCKSSIFDLQAFLRCFLNTSNASVLISPSTVPYKFRHYTLVSIKCDLPSLLRTVDDMLSTHMSITSLSHSWSHPWSIHYQLDTHHRPIVSMVSHDYIILLITQTSKPPTSWPDAYPNNLSLNTLVLSRYVCIISAQFCRSIIFPLSKRGHRVEVGTER